MAGSRQRAGLMRKLHEASGSTETYSPAEELFNRRRRTVGLFGAPVVLLFLLFFPMPLPAPAHRLAAILAMMVVLWVTEALPLAVTALIGPRAGHHPGRGPGARRVCAIRRSDHLPVHRELHARRGDVRARPRPPHRVRRVVLAAWSAAARRAFSSCTAPWAAGLSMWISNTATTAMMFPIGLSIVAHITEGREAEAGSRDFAMAMMLMAAFGASVGGIGTPIGTPPNLIGIGMLARITGARITFFQWMLIGLPIVVILFAFLVGYFYWRSLRHLTLEAARTDMIQEELRRLGPMTGGQRNVVIAFATTVILWLIPGVLAIVGLGGSGFGRAFTAAVPESVAAMTGAILLFLLPVSWRARRFTLTWEEAIKIDWGIVLLFGGGLAMGELAFSTGLAESMGRGITSWLPVHTATSLTVVFTAVAIVMSEAASNTASANMIVPVAIAVSQAAGVSPIEPALGATLGASMGFMMPISTPPNAIVYSSGYVPITAMMKHGIALDVAGFVVIVLVITGFGWMF